MPVDLELPLGSCVATYVLDTVRSKRKIQEVVQNLKEGQPFVESEFMAVAMVDISGYSSLTSMLSQRGKISSELITQTVASYLNKIIEIIAVFQGDIVKFLGDAVLVCFSAISPDETSKSICQRAVQCCTQVLISQSEATIDISDYSNFGEQDGMEASGSGHLLGNDSSLKANLLGAPKDEKQAFSSFRSIRKELKDAGGNNASYSANSFTLRVHSAVAAGIMTRMVIGVPEERLDYCVFGHCLNEISGILDGAKPGELGMSEVVRSYCGIKPRKDFNCRNVPKGIVVEQSALIPLMEMVSEEADNYLDIDQKIELAVRTYRKSNTVASGSPIEEQRLGRFINQSLLHKLRLAKPVREFLTTALIGASGEDDDGSMIDMTRASSARGAAAKSTNRTISLKLSAGESSLPSNSEYRTLTTIFVKLYWSVSPESAQRVIEAFLAVLKKFSGVFQQYSVDDKGQTMLAFFGLPPWNHENNASRAVSAAKEFKDLVNQMNFGAMTISLATGDLLVSRLGNEIRSEASFLGDAVNVAARLLSLGKDKIYCDQKTYDLSKSTASWQCIGQHRLKGQKSDIVVYSANEGSNRSTRHKMVVTIVEGSSGLGKSTVLEFVARYMKESSISFILTKVSENDRVLPYAGIQKIFARVFASYFSDEPHTEALKPYTTKEGPYIRKASDVGAGSLNQTNFASFVGSDSKKADTIFSASNAEQFLSKLGEPTDLAPLLKLVLPFLQIPSNQKVKSLDKQARYQTLRVIIMRALCLYIVNASGPKKLAFLFDDVQWLDPVSTDILLALAKMSPKSCIIMFTRPIKEYSLEIMKAFFQLSTVTHIKLEGLMTSDIEQILLAKFREHHSCKSISHDLLRSIYDRSTGSPLFTDLIGDKLLDVFNSVFVEKEIANRKCQTFNLKDIAAALPELFEVNNLTEWITLYDKYSYLAPEGNQPLTYVFRYKTYMNCIYESQPYSERIQVHVKFAEYFEGRLNDENRQELLPYISHHYNSSGNVQMSIVYLEELGYMYAKGHQIRESIEAFSKLIPLVEKNASKIRKEFPVEFAEILKPERRAEWHILLAKSLIKIMDFPSSEAYLIRALSLLGHEWPQDPTVMKTLIKRGIASYLRLRLKSSFGNGSKRVLNSDQLNSDIMKIQALTCMVETFFWDQSDVKHEYFLARIEAANLSLRCTINGSAHHAKELIHQQFVLFWDFHWLSGFHRTHLNKVLMSLKEPHSTAVQAQYYWLCLIDAAKGDMEDLDAKLGLYLQNRESHGDVYGCFQGWKLKMMMDLLCGRPTEGVEKQLMDNIDTFLQEGVWNCWGTAACLLGIVSLLRGDSALAQKWIDHLNHNIEQIPDLWGFMTAGFQSVKIIKFMISGNTAEAIEAFVNFGHSVERVNRFLPVFAITSVVIPYLMLNVILDSTSTDASSTSLQAPQKEKLLKGFEAVARGNYCHSKTIRSVINIWGCVVSDAAVKYLKGGQFDKSHFHGLHKMVRKKAMKEQLEKFTLIKGLVYSTLSKTAGSDGERREYAQVAGPIFEAQKLKVLADWAKI
ncbi:hypothetical protein HDV05_007803 [Chytridiales sp. JEL 0842]|nr:hypothetical protein HDV05_007803 [Chytridiales sp. JEL 0842]